MQSFDLVVLVFSLRQDGSLLALKYLVYPSHSTISRNIFENMNFLDNIFQKAQQYYLLENLERQYLLGIVQEQYISLVPLVLLGRSSKSQTKKTHQLLEICGTNSSFSANSTLYVPIFFWFINFLLRCVLSKIHIQILNTYIV